MATKQFLDTDGLLLVASKIDSKQDSLPNVVYGAFLHANQSTGNLEWTKSAITKLTVSASSTIKDVLDLAGADNPFVFYLDSSQKEIIGCIHQKNLNNNVYYLVEMEDMTSEARFVYDNEEDTSLPAINSLTLGTFIGSSSYRKDYAFKSALAGKADLVDGKVPSSELPSYVDDVIEFYKPADNAEKANVPIITEANLDAITTVSDLNTIFGTSIDLTGGGDFGVICYIYNGESGTESSETVYYGDLWYLFGSGSGSLCSINRGSAYSQKLDKGKIYVSDGKIYRVAENVRYHATDTSTANVVNGFVPIGAGMTNPMTAQGDIIYGGSSGTPTALAKGTAGQLLAMNSGATAPEWKTVTLPPMGTAYGSGDTAIGSTSIAGASGQNYYATAYGYYARATGDSSTAVGKSSTASTNYATAIGTSSYASSSSVSVGYLSTTQGSRSTAIGRNSTANADYSTALGAYAYTSIASTVSIYGYNVGDKSTTLLVKDPSHIFFANENATSTTNSYTALSSFTSGKYLADYLVEANPTVPSGTTPTSLTGLKVGLGSSSVYYSIDSGSSIPTVTIELTQVVQQSPLKIQLTSDQVTAFSSAKVIEIDLSALGESSVLWTYSYGDISTELVFGFSDGADGYSVFHRIEIVEDSSVYYATYTSETKIVQGIERYGSANSADEGKLVIMDSDGWGDLTELKTVNGSSILGSGNVAIESVKTGTEGSATSVSLKFWQGTQQQYDAILTKDANTLYIVKGS